MKVKSCLSNPTAFYKMTGLVDKGRAQDIIKIFSTVSHNIFTGTLMKYGLDKWMVD